MNEKKKKKKRIDTNLMLFINDNLMNKKEIKNK